jgi:hypothetical protein
MLTWGIYPNPAQQSITIMGWQQGCRASITDMQGNMLKYYAECPANLQVDFLSSGLYLLTVQTANEVISLPLQVLK